MARNGDRKRGFELEQRRRRVFDAWSQGRPQHEIADAEKVHPSQITRDLDAILRRLAAADQAAAEKNRLRLLGKLAHAEAELLAAWERSKKPRKREKASKTETEAREGKGKAGANVPLRRFGETVTEQRDGNPAIWERLTEIWKEEAKLLGLYAPTKIAPTTPDGNECWHASPDEQERILGAAFSRLGYQLSPAGGQAGPDGNGRPVDAADPDHAGGGS